MCVHLQNYYTFFTEAKINSLELRKLNTIRFPILAIKQNVRLRRSLDLILSMIEYDMLCTYHKQHDGCH